MKTAVVEYEGDWQEKGIPERVLGFSKRRLNAFHVELLDLVKRNDRFVFSYVFYSVEKVRKLRRTALRRQFWSLPLNLRLVSPKMMSVMEDKEVIVYGNAGEPEERNLVKAYLTQHRIQEIYAPFYDGTESVGEERTDGSYPELQKALFFCQRRKTPLLFVSVRELMQDVNFLNLLEKSLVDFRCVDFPWFCRENLALIKAVVLYEKLKK